MHSPPAIRLAIVACALLLSLRTDSASGMTAARPWHAWHPFLAATCLDCHGADEPAGGLDLSPNFQDPRWIDDYRTWHLIRRKIAWGEMPPPDARGSIWDPTLERLIADAMRQEIRIAARQYRPSYGRLPLRRLSRFAFGNSVKDVLRIPFDVSANLPADGGGGEGFDNAAETLFITPLHAEKYMQAARQAVDYALKTTSARADLFSSQPTAEVAPRVAASANLMRVAARAFRRPVTEEDLMQYLSLFDRSFAASADFEQSVADSIAAILLSPRFLYLEEEPADDEKGRRLRDHELAARLALFLSCSIPDETLAQAADAKLLSDLASLREQTQRLMSLPSFRQFADDFVQQWLGTRSLQGIHKPNAELFPEYDDRLRAAFQEEPVLFVEEIFRENRSLLELIHGKFSYLNGRLAEHYGLQHDHAQADRTVRVELPADSPRGGLLTMAAVLTATSYPHRTSPVLRGKWVLDNLLGSPPHPPPPNIPALDTPGRVEPPTTLQAKLIAHRSNPVCAGCHEAMDTVGFGLEAFDPIGRVRELGAGFPTDQIAPLPGGIPLEGAHSIKEWILARQDDFIRNLVARMFGYALGRGLVPADYPDLEAAVERLERNDYHAQELIFSIVESETFRRAGP